MNAMSRDVANGNLEIVQRLYPNRSKGYDDACMDEAGCEGHLEMLRWLHVNGFESCTNSGHKSCS